MNSKGSFRKQPVQPRDPLGARRREYCLRKDRDGDRRVQIVEEPEGAKNYK